MARSLKISTLRIFCITILLTAGSRALSMQDDNTISSTRESLQQQKKVYEIITQKGMIWDDVVGMLRLNGWNEMDKKYELKKLSQKGCLNANAVYVGIPAIHYAIGHGYPKIVKFLVKKGADTNIECVGTLHTPIHSAILAGNIEVVKFLITKGADVNKQSHEGTSAVQMAAQCGYAELVKILIDNKVDIQKKDIVGSTALHSAALFGNKKTLELLVLNGIDHTVKNSQKFTALGIAKFGSKNIDLVKDCRVQLESAGTQFYEDTNKIEENLSANIAYLKLVKDFYGFLKMMREGAQMFGEVFKNQFITETFESFAKNYFTGENGGQNFTDVQKLLPLDKDKHFTQSFNTWRKNNTVFGASAGSTITAQPTALTPNGLTNTNLCATMGNLSLNQK